MGGSAGSFFNLNFLGADIHPEILAIGNDTDAANIDTTGIPLGGTFATFVQENIDSVFSSDPQISTGRGKARFVKAGKVGNGDVVVQHRGKDGKEFVLVLNKINVAGIVLSRCIPKAQLDGSNLFRGFSLFSRPLLLAADKLASQSASGSKAEPTRSKLLRG